MVVLFNEFGCDEWGFRPAVRPCEMPVRISFQFTLLACHWALRCERVLKWLIRTRLRVLSVLSEHQPILRGKVVPQKLT